MPPYPTWDTSKAPYGPSGTDPYRYFSDIPSLGWKDPMNPSSVTLNQTFDNTPIKSVYYTNPDGIMEIKVGDEPGWNDPHPTKYMDIQSDEIPYYLHLSTPGALVDFAYCEQWIYLVVNLSKVGYAKYKIFSSTDYANLCVWVEALGDKEIVSTDAPKDSGIFHWSQNCQILRLKMENPTLDNWTLNTHKMIQYFTGALGEGEK